MLLELARVSYPFLFSKCPNAVSILRSAHVTIAFAGGRIGIACLVMSRFTPPPGNFPGRHCEMRTADPSKTSRRIKVEWNLDPDLARM